MSSRARRGMTLTSCVRTIPADALTPIGAYLALCQGARACMLESVEHGGRLSRYTFIGLDYLAAAEFEASDSLYDRVREFVATYRPGGEP
ncbi:MAG TPA: hypothetical protein VKB39_05405, partial [Candidatus Baltobacteraceae bacterium]|nr:hypothetical protein [Candidatus Baltobacteraceae bacterium]